MNNKWLLNLLYPIAKSTGVNRNNQYSKVGNTCHALPFWRIASIRLLYGCAGSFKAPGQSRARPVMPTTGIWLQAFK